MRHHLLMAHLGGLKAESSQIREKLRLVNRNHLLTKHNIINKI
jgi:hypothetical protein